MYFWIRCEWLKIGILGTCTIFVEDHEYIFQKRKPFFWQLRKFRGVEDEGAASAPVFGQHRTDVCREVIRL